MNAHTAISPNLPALISAIPGDHTRAPQTEFVRARQVVFIDRLSVTGSVRAAARAAGVSHQSAYRARRSCAQFRLAWNAALVAARRCAEDPLAARAIDGVEEQVFYHGEVIATRRRYCSRLLLAHLARLDKLAGDDAAIAFAEDWDAAMARFAAGEEAVPAAPDEPAEKHSPRPCNTWSMSPGAEPESVPEEEETEEELAEAMAQERPAHAPPPELLGDPAAVAACQREVFALGEEEWWCYGENYGFFQPGPDGIWRAEEEGGEGPDDGGAAA
ncbi:hypothetical protein [Qipengyuania marisflavi]|uniref:Uncharacterized protein n=1 Tax=Qipengyuania marisflavi TaxID=2486356 RepID=A0A5S3P9Q4_9SPHN|nr:hypothetical protein [Qipengyuania marisflavi]TMM50191.1 hypothetical protein FEV51_03110 [Qipengyuania marisflavi]